MAPRSLPTRESRSWAISAGGPKVAPPSRETEGAIVPVSPPPRNTITSVPVGLHRGHREDTVADRHRGAPGRTAVGARLATSTSHAVSV